MENTSVNDEDEIRTKKTRCLKKISELGQRLQEHGSQYPHLCENYLNILNNIEAVVSKHYVNRRKQKNVLDKCEDELNRYWNIIISSDFSATREVETLPDSTATYGNTVNNTSESGRYVYDRRKPDNSRDYHPDSTTLVEGPFSGSSKHPNALDADNEVSSSQETIKTNSMHVPDNTFPSLYSRRRDNNDEVERSSNEINPVTMILNTVESRLGREMLNHSSHSTYGMSSSEEIERYEGTLKSQFFENELPEKPVHRETHDENKLSSMLEKMMVRRESSSTSEIPSASNLSTELSAVPDLNNLNLSPEKNDDPLQKKDRPLSARARIAQDFNTLHKAGESNRIHPSLKQLKSDKSLASSSSPRSDDKVSVPPSKDVDDYRSKRSSEFRRHSDRYPHSPHSPLSHSRRSSRESSLTYSSPRDSQDDYHRFDRRRRSRSRSRERYRDQYLEKSNNKKSSPKKSVNDESQSTSFKSFVNSIGHGRCTLKEPKDDENQRKEDRNKNDSDDSKTNNLKIKKKNIIKFKVNTNLSVVSKIDKLEESSPAEVEPASTTNPSDNHPPSPAFHDSFASSRVPLLPDTRLPQVNNYGDKRDRFSKVSTADPRLKKTFSKNSDPRLERRPYQKTGFFKDPRVPPPASTIVTKGSDDFRSRIATKPPDVGFSNVPRTPDTGFHKDPRTLNTISPLLNKETSDKFHHPRIGAQPPESGIAKDTRTLSSPPVSTIPQEMKTSCSSFSPNKSKPPKTKWQPNKLGNSSKPFTGRKKYPNQNAFQEAKTSKTIDKTDIRQQVKNSNEFLSPLQDIFQTNEVAKTGRGYGDQKLKKHVQNPTALKKFTIPKIRKPSVEVDNNDDNWNDVLENVTSTTYSGNSAKGSKKKIFHDDEDEDNESAAISNKNDDATTARPESSSFIENSASDKNEKRGESTNYAPSSAEAVIDEEECWDPVDSPEPLVPPEPLIPDSNMTKNTAEITQTDPVTIEIDDDDIQTHDDIEDLTQDKKCDEVIEIDDNDDVDKSTTEGEKSSVGCVRRRSSSLVLIDEACTVESNKSTEIRSVQNLIEGGGQLESVEPTNILKSPKRFPGQSDTRCPTSSDLPTQCSNSSNDKSSSVANNASDGDSKQDASSTHETSKSENELTNKILVYLKSIPNPPEILEKDVKLSAQEFLIKLLPQITLEAFTVVQGIIAEHEKSNQKESNKVTDAEAPNPPTDIEKLPPVKPGRGRKKWKKTDAKFEVELKTTSEPKPVTNLNLNPAKKRCRELDRLHADIEKLRKTKNNVMDIGSTRKCRLQPANYTDTKVYRRSNEEWVNQAQFENEFEKTTRRGGIRRSRSKVDLGSDSDSVSSSKKFKSRAFISSDSSSDADSENENTSSSAHDDIRKYKACPRRMKIKRFGSACYEQYEEVERRRDILHMKKLYCPKEAITVIPKVPSTCDNFTRCVCHDKVSFNDVKPKCGENVKLEGTGSMFAKVDNKPIKMLAKNYSKSPKKRKSKLGKTSQLRVKMSKSVHCPNWQVVKNQVRNQIGADLKDKTSENKASCSDNISKPATLSGFDSHVSTPEPERASESSTTTKGDQVLESTTADDDTNDELKDLPPCNAFKNPDITTVEIATIGVHLSDSALIYICKTNGCLYKSLEIDMFVLHITFLHKLWKIDAACKLCENTQKYLNLKSAFRHLVEEHLKFIPDLNSAPVTNVQIKEEPLDETPVDDVTNKESTIEAGVPTETAASTAQLVPIETEPSVAAPEPVSTPPPSVDSSEIVLSSTNSSPMVRNPPKIRVRRFSGDKLSGPETSSDSQRSTPEIRNIPVQAANLLSEACNNASKNNSNLIVNSSVGDPNNVSSLSDITELDFLPYNFTNAELNLIQFYKCPDETCGFSSNHKKEFVNHLHNVHKGVKRNRKFAPGFLTCKYCSKKFDTPEMLVIHMEKYVHCKFQCAYCEFRASRPVYLLWHLNACHIDQAKKILVSSLDDNKEDVVNCSAVEKNLKEVVMPINCVHCEKFQTISFEEYIDHWNKNHLQSDWVCFLCQMPSFSVDRGLKHMKLHGYGEFQCVYCKHGVINEEAIISHLLKEHYTLYPKFVKRIMPSNPETANKFDDYVEVLDLDQSVGDLKRHFRVIDANRSSTVTVHAETPDGTVSATVNINQASPCAGDSNSDDVIAVCSSDDETDDRLIINEDALAASSKAIPKAMYSKELSGTDLYKCGFIGCTAAFETYVPFKEHLSICDIARNRTSPKCPHCNRTFQKNAAFLTHIGLHGIPRYICSLCDGRFTSAKKGEDHMKQVHKVNSFKVIPANPLKDNSHEDLYIVLPNSEKGGGKGNKQFKKFTDLKNLPTTSTVTTAKSKEAADIPAKQITTVYSLQDVEEYLPMQLFSEPVTCGICSTYNSKVRQNIIVHLQDHSTGLVPVNDITNPVPCTDKSELMFNKMTNHAAFSAKADDKKIKCMIEKVEAYSGDKNEIIPAFIPKTSRFSCGVADCVYRSTDAIRLKSHFETLHSESNFNCPHCNIVIPVDKIQRHLRYHDGRLYKCYYCTKLHYQRQSIENHQQETHPDSEPQVQVIRELTVDEMEELSREARYPNDASYYRNTVTSSKTSIWRCNLCKSYPMMSEELVKSHCATQHRIGQRYKCCLCNFSHSDKSQVNKHMNEEHESISQVIVTVYQEVTENDESSQPSSNASSPGRVRNNPQSLNSSDKQMRNNGNGSGGNSDDKFKNDDLSKNKTDDSQNSEMSGLLILPLSNNRYVCPFCNEYNTADRKIMREHLYQEKKYERYVCYDCGTHSVTEDEIKRHAESVHGETINIGKFSEDEVIEKQVEQILDYQQNKFSQVNDENAIEISSGEEDEEISPRRYSRDSSLSSDRSGVAAALAGRSNVEEFRCPHCPKVCSNSAGLKNHINYVHMKRGAKKNKSRPQTPAQNAPKPAAKISPLSFSIVPNVNGIYPCSYCGQEFPTASTIAKHLCVCPKYSNSSEKFSTKAVLTNERVLACSYCGKRCSQFELDDHIDYCKSKQMHLFQRKMGCVPCGLEADDDSQTERHIKCKHQPMECLNCDKVLMGSEELDNHVHESLINISGSKQTCIHRPKDVVIMCPYCPTGLIGQSYDKYTYISDHIDKKHTITEKPAKRIRVKIRDTVRELMDSEITLMQSKFNKEQGMNSIALPPEKKKKRNVAVKSTSRASATSTVGAYGTVASNEGVRSTHPLPKVNIIYKGSKR